MDFHSYTTMRDWTRRAYARGPPRPRYRPVLQENAGRCRGDGVSPVLRPNAQRTGLGKGTAALLQPVALHHPDARPGSTWISIPT